MEPRRTATDAIFVDANEVPEEKREVASPSGRHLLTIRVYSSRPGACDHTRGTVTRAVDGTEVCDIKRTHDVFHHAFVTKDGRELLVSGRSFTSQTIVDLDRGAVYESPGDPADAEGFCWTWASLSPDGNTLAVDGCHWACPYQYRFYDFTDPARGWPQLPIDDDSWIDADNRHDPRWVGPDTFECYQHAGPLEPGEAPRPDICTRVRRDGGQMVVVERSISEHEQERRRMQAATEAAHRMWWEAFTQEEPMYLRMVEAIREHGLPDEPDLVPADRHVVKWFRRAEPKAAADLRWDTDERLLYVRVYYERGEAAHDISFEHSVEGMSRAIARIAKAFAT